MSNYYQQNLYTNTYSLWENSAYYDINNLSPQNFSSSWHRSNDDDFETRYTSGPTEAQPSEPPDIGDHRNRRIVARSALYADPAAFYRGHTGGSSPTPTEWARIRWNDEEPEESTTWIRGKMMRIANIQDQNEMMTTPKVSKADKMMQKMGWQCGPLGRTGIGVLEPLEPDPSYAADPRGVGHDYDPEINFFNLNNFDINVLYHILAFVRNNSEVELLFQRTVTKVERKRIRFIVEHMLIDKEFPRGVGNSVIRDIVGQICEVNCYVLSTQSEGEHPFRQICIYKEAPAAVYMIIPDDLRGDVNLDDSSSERDDEKGDVSDPEVEEETNPFLRSITRNLKKSKESAKVEKEAAKEMSVFEKILEYFSEFTTKRQYNQFKFLGPFTEIEIDGIRQFIKNAKRYKKNEPADAKEIFDKISFEIEEDATGNTVIRKRPN